MYRRGDPRLRRTLNEISQTLESANESAQANIFSFSQHYVGPCLSGLNKCFEPCAGACFPARDQRTRRLRGRSNGRAELSFDFYDDWDDDENDGLLGWGNDEFDRLVSGGGGYGTSTQPARQRAMSYGARRDAKGRRKNVAAPHDVGDDPTMIPSSSYFGFFGKLTGKMGGKSLKYKPSAADLQEHPGAAKKYAGGVGEPLLEDSEEEEGVGRRKRHGRARSGTAGSGNTTDSFSSRGDIFPSEDEDDAVPLDDEFAMVLERRTTNSGHDETSSGKTPRSSKRPSTGSRRTTRTISSRSTRSSKRQSTQSRTTSKSPVRNAAIDQDVPAVVADLNELKQEEERLRLEQEQSIAIKREAAQRLAQKRGLSISEPPVSTT